MTLLADVICPESQKDVVCDWQPAQFGGRCDLGAETAVAPCLLPLVAALLPLCLQEGRIVNGRRLALLWYSLGRKHARCHCAN